ncbi:MAG: 16S rRNA (cytosine(1402)-N(4))-methyltransferase, partial [Bacilli bacterium]|nr:16S rRNA (cytosine(1402)-N(4))-methyltransferase [Bacilli bacterium]
HPAKRVFQAIRIEVNKELEVFEKALNDAVKLLNKDGRICVITFHSLEDKICKDIFKKNSEISSVFKNIPNIPYEYMPNLKVIGKIKPSKKELEENNRARSSTLRIAEKIK